MNYHDILMRKPQPQLYWLLSVQILFLISTIENSDLANGQCLDDQQSNLLQLKNSLSFDFELSTRLVQWTPEEDCCSWRGVECDAFGRVITLELDHESITGGVDNFTGLFELQFLEKLNLGFNNFRDIPIPKAIANLTNLVYLNLSNSGFVGQIPIELSSLRKLVSLDLSTLFNRESSMKLENPTLKMLVQNLSQIEEIYLDHVDLSAQKSEWFQAIAVSLPKLRVLSLQNCHISGPIHISLSSIHDLSIIHLDGNNISAEVPEFFANMPNLRILSLSSCNLLGHFPVKIFQVPALETLDIFNNQLLLGSFLPFPKNSSLRTIVLSYTNFSGSLPNSIGNLHMLSRLELSFCNFNGTIPAALPELSQLAFADLSYNNFSGPVPLFNASKNVVYIDLSHNSLTGSLIGLDLYSTSFLSVSNNSLTGHIPDSICNATSLRVLDMSYNAFNGTIPSCLVTNSYLAVLNLADNNLSGSIPDEFSANCSLKILDLGMNHLQGELPRTLSSCTPLRVLNLRYNKIEDVFPCMFENSSSLRVLILQSNKFHGELQCFGDRYTWPQLQIIDVGSNNFSGVLSPEFFSSLSNMVTPDFYDFGFNFININNFYYQFKVRVIRKGHETELSTTFPIIDFSNNKFSGKIPATIRDLKLLTSLNLSRNGITGEIPSSIGRLQNLDALDLSMNQLTGEIPSTLTELDDLSFLNLSFNSLTGKIPTRSRLKTFSINSYKGNVGLCGVPLNVTCIKANVSGSSSIPSFGNKNANDSGSSTIPSFSNKNANDSGSSTIPSLSNKREIDWMYICASLGYTVGLGIFSTLLLFSERWRNKLFLQVDLLGFKILGKKRARRVGPEWREPIRRL